MQSKLLAELFLSGFGDQIACKSGASEFYTIPTMEDKVRIHPYRFDENVVKLLAIVVVV